jgi:hypothetical protein
MERRDWIAFGLVMLFLAAYFVLGLTEPHRFE